ncbi:MAG: polyprenyl synthetase family protein [Planctomycetes bacterium]|nr:polyprenyl synthetase family protein [Planctomycetota bacterium]
MRSDYAYVDELVRYGVMLGGKRLRPALLLLAARATGEVNRSHYVLSAVVEMIHTATLVHDDVLDEAATRRRLATVNSRWDNEASVLLGDFLFTHAFYLASTLETTYACRTIGRSTNIVCEGELRQKGSRGDFSLSEREYFEIIDAKTAELCACACRLGAHYAGGGESTVEAMARYGRNLGVAFQIADDLLDVVGHEGTVGKSLGTDLEKQKPTLPVIHILQRATTAEKAQVLEILEGDAADKRDLLAPWLDRFDAVSYSRKQARKFAAAAQEDLTLLPPSPAVETLRRLTDFVVHRSL